MVGQSLSGKKGGKIQFYGGIFSFFRSVNSMSVVERSPSRMPSIGNPGIIAGAFTVKVHVADFELPDWSLTVTVTA